MVTKLHHTLKCPRRCMLIMGSHLNIVSMSKIVVSPKLGKVTLFSLTFIQYDCMIGLLSQASLYFEICYTYLAYTRWVPRECAVGKCLYPTSLRVASYIFHTNDASLYGLMHQMYGMVHQMFDSVHFAKISYLKIIGAWAKQERNMVGSAQSKCDMLQKLHLVRTSAMRTSCDAWRVAYFL